jgi:NAD(P)-dependent dehydrogenase (short-subunit alcohol dehydrogenase family)
MSDRFADRTVLVTGGARGQGAAHAERLSREGARVYIADVLDDAGDAHAAALRGEGLDVDYLHLDISDPHSWAAGREQVQAGGGRLDGLVNNAGVIHVTAIEDETLGAWNRLIGINLTGTFLGLQSMLPLLRAAGRASVVNVSSIFGPAGAIGYAAYAASKAGILGLTRTAALELAADGIRVNALVPGGVSTPMNENEPEGGVVPETPLGRRAHVRELAAAVSYLLSDDASFVTGTELVVDGGFLAR